MKRGRLLTLNHGDFVDRIGLFRQFLLRSELRLQLGNRHGGYHPDQNRDAHDAGPDQNRPAAKEQNQQRGSHYAQFGNQDRQKRFQRHFDAERERNIERLPHAVVKCIVETCKGRNCNKDGRRMATHSPNDKAAIRDCGQGECGRTATIFESIQLRLQSWTGLNTLVL